MPWGSTPDSALPQGAYSPGQLASVLQDQSAAKFRTLAAGRFPAIVGGTSAGDPGDVDGPLGFVVGLAGRFYEHIATADPSTINGPDDLVPFITDFFTDLPLEVVIWALAVLLGWLTDTDPSEWDTAEEIQANLIPALIRLPLKVIVDIIGDVPIIGDAVEDGFAKYLAQSREAAAAAQTTANEALAIAQGVAAGGISLSETFVGANDTSLSTSKWEVSSNRLDIQGNQLGMDEEFFDGTYQEWARHKTSFSTDNHSAAIVLGAKGNDTQDTGLMVRANNTLTSFVYVNICNDRMWLGKGSRSGSSWTFNDYISATMDLKDGDAVLLKAVGTTFSVFVNGALRMQHTDPAAPIGSGNRNAGVREKYVKTLAFFHYMSFRIRSFAMADVAS